MTTQPEALRLAAELDEHRLRYGEAVRHEFRIQKLRHDVALYPGISLAEAKKRFRERVEADNE